MTNLDDLDDLTVEQRSKLDAAKAKEKEARRLRREGHDTEAIKLYDRARDAYADSGLAFHESGESTLASAVLGAIKRCDAIVSNLRHPKPKREPAITPRPPCLGCGKPLPRFKFDGKTYDDGTPREWGAYGDNRFCTLTCGWRWACRRAPMPVEADVARDNKREAKG